MVVVVESGGVEREEGLPQLSNCEHRGGWGSRFWSFCDNVVI